MQIRRSQRRRHSSACGGKSLLFDPPYFDYDSQSRENLPPALRSCRVLALFSPSRQLRLAHESAVHKALVRVLTHVLHQQDLSVFSIVPQIYSLLRVLRYCGARPLYSLYRGSRWSWTFQCASMVWLYSPPHPCYSRGYLPSTAWCISISTHKSDPSCRCSTS